MRKRSTEILEKLILSNGRSLEAEKLITTYKISWKTLKADLSEINDFLGEIKMSPVFLNEDGKIILQENHISEVQNAIDHMDTYSYKMSREERQIFIMAFLLQSQGYVTMQNLAKELNVSRNTILNDFEIVKDYCQAFHIDVFMKSSKGIKVTYEQMDKQNLMIDLFLEMEKDYLERSFFYQLIQRKLKMTIPIQQIKGDFREYMQEEHILFADREFLYLSIYFFVFLNEKKNEGIEGEVTIGTCHEKNDVLSWFARKYRINITEEDKRWFQSYMERKDFDIHLEPKVINDVELYGIVVYFLRQVGQDIHCSLQTDTVLIDSLLEHIRTLRNWENHENYGVDMSLSEDLPIPKEILLDTMEKNSGILEKYLGYPLTKEMKASIIIHICAAFVRNREYLNLLKVLIVCPGSMATGKYLEAQVKNYFDFQIAGVVPSKDAAAFLEQEKVDFMISTVDVNIREIPLIKVGAQLTMNDINTIQNMAFLLGRKEENKNQKRQMNDKKRFLHIMKSFVQKLEEEDSKEFFEEVYHLMGNRLHLGNNSVLANMLSPSKILIEEKRIGWEQGIKEAADILEEEGCVGANYGEKAIANVREYGDYIVISKGIALAHAGKESDVYKDGLSLVVCPEGIEFSERNTVYLVFCFAVAGEKDYLKLFQEIIALGKKEEKMRKLLQQKDEIEVYHTLALE